MNHITCENLLDWRSCLCLLDDSSPKQGDSQREGCGDEPEGQNMKDTGEEKKKRCNNKRSFVRLQFFTAGTFNGWTFLLILRATVPPCDWAEKLTLSPLPTCACPGERWQKLCMAKNVYAAPEMTSGIGKQIHKTELLRWHTLFFSITHRSWNPTHQDTEQWFLS